MYLTIAIGFLGWLSLVIALGFLFLGYISDGGLSIMNIIAIIGFLFLTVICLDGVTKRTSIPELKPQKNCPECGKILT